MRGRDLAKLVTDIEVEISDDILKDILSRMMEAIQDNHHCIDRLEHSGDQSWVDW
jgi:hypothetical protein